MKKAMKKRFPRKLKKGMRTFLRRRDTKWKRKAKNIAQQALQVFFLSFHNSSSVKFEAWRHRGGIVSDKPVSNRGEYVVTKDERQGLEEMLRRERETVHVSISLDDITTALKKKILGRNA